MKNSIIIILALLFTSFSVYSQEMTWIPSDYSVYGGCENLTNCDENIVCYKLQYTPLTSGVLTSYTTGFFADCQSGETTLVENLSCMMTNNSRQVEACQQVGKILMNCSANSGTGSECTLEEGVPVILHQVCFQVSDGNHITIIEDEKTDLTTSIDVNIDGNFHGKTEFPIYNIYETKNEQICHNAPNDISIGAVPTVENATILNWTPAGETGSGKYIIERSIEAEAFKPINTVNDRNFDIDLLRYELIDTKAAFGYNHYRVIYIDKEGNRTVSDIGSVYHFDGNFSIDIYPNPVENFMQLKVNSSTNSFNWTILDETGKNVLQGQETGIRTTQIDLQKLTSGAYFLTLQSGGQSISEKFIKIN